MREETKRKALMWLSITFFVAFAISLGWGITQYRMLQDQKIAIENQYKRALNDLVEDLNEVETSMSKVKAAGSTPQRVLYLSQVWKGSDNALNRFSQLPADEVGISYVDTLVNQVADFSKTLSTKVATTGKIEPEEQKTFNAMHERITEVARSVQEISNQFYAENLAWVDKKPGMLQKMGLNWSTWARGQALEKGLEGDGAISATAQGQEESGNDSKDQKQAAQKPSSVRGGLKQLDASLQKYPPFTYAGELDKHYVEKPLGLPEGTIDENKAISVAKSFLQQLGYTRATPKVTGLTDAPLGGFNLLYNDAYLEVSKKGGVVTFYRDQREIGERKLEVEEALEKAKKALKKLDWNLEITSTEDLDSYVQVEAVALENGVRLYPDKVRLTIALDSGQLIGLDANPYYAYHHDRKLNKKLSLEEAKAKLAPNFKIVENRLALISKAGTEEAFCYEFRGTIGDEEYLVYINALDGTEEKISRIVNTPRGKLIQ
ncbi:MAG: PepSY1/2 domain-containing protein [Desulfitobacteriia bacterium]|jgi:spore germination protein